VVRAALDSIAYQVRDALAAMEKDSGRRVRELRVDGGATANGYLMQFQADVLGRPVRRPRMAETTALGAAMLAGLAVGLWRSPDELAALGGSGRLFYPSMRPAERDRLVSGWQAAVARVRS
jgi:glycerol kinase